VDFLGVIAFLVINLQGGVAQPVQVTNVVSAQP
jgi:hypothetical protein